MRRSVAAAKSANPSTVNQTIIKEDIGMELEQNSESINVSANGQEQQVVFLNIVNKSIIKSFKPFLYLG